MAYSNLFLLLIFIFQNRFISQYIYIETFFLIDAMIVVYGVVVLVILHYLNLMPVSFVSKKREDFHGMMIQCVHTTTKEYTST